MDIRVVVRQGIVYICAIVASFTLFVVAADLLRQLAHYDKDHVPLLDAAVVATVLAIGFQPLKNRLNRYLYRETYDYQRTIRAASRQLSTILELGPLLDHLTGVIRTTFKAEAVTVYLHDDARKVLVFRSPPDPWHQPPTVLELPYTSPLVQLFQVDTIPVVREETVRRPADQRRVAATQVLKQLGADLAFPLTEEKTILGIILVGPKRSGDPYFAEDLDLLETLVAQAARAMKNAQLYQQVVLVNEYVDNILSTMDSGVIAITADGDISLFNRAAERLTGHSALALQNKPYHNLPTALASPLRDALYDHVVRSQFEVVVQSDDGVNVPLVCSTAVLRQKTGTPHGALVVFSDLTRLKYLEREKRRAERLAAFGALASGVAHEIKNPLVAIRTFAELLPERFDDTDFREDFAKVVVREITRIDDLVGRLRGIAGTTSQQPETVDIRKPIGDTLRLLRAKLEQTRTTSSCDFRDQEPFVAVEETQLKQLFLNLFLNAIEAMGSDGDLAVHVYRRSLLDSDWIVVTISDTGPGIPDSIRASVFDPFFTTKPRGSGLGLAICRGIADANRGTIRCENRTDRPGTIMIVEFPAAKASPVPADEKVLGTSGFVGNQSESLS